MRKELGDPLKKGGGGQPVIIIRIQEQAKQGREGKEDHRKRGLIKSEKEGEDGEKKKRRRIISSQ